MAAVVDAVTTVANTVVDTVSSVGTQAVKAVSDAGQAIVDKVVTPVVKAVENTAKAIEADPVNSLIKIGTAIVAPELLPLVTTTIAVAQGKPLDKALEQGAIAYVAQQAGGYVKDALNAPVGSTYGPDNIDAGGGFNPATGLPSTLPVPDVPSPLSVPQVDPTVAKLAGNVASSATSAALSGKDALKGAESGLTSGAISAGTTAGANEISNSNLENWSQQNAQNAYENAPSPTEQDVLAADTSVPLPAPLATPPESTGTGYYDETTGAFVPSDTGVVQAPLTDTSGTNLDSMKDYTVNPATNTVTTPTGETVDLSNLSNTQSPLDTAAVLPAPTETPPESYDPIKQSTIKSGLDYVANAVINPAKTGTATPTTNPTTPTAGATTPTSLSQQVYKDPTLSSETQYLGPKDTTSQNTITDPAKLHELQQLYASLDPRLKEELQARGIVPMETTAPTTPLDASMYNTKLVANGGSINSYASGSSVTDSYDPSVFNPTITKTNPNMLPPAPVIQMPSRLGALKHIFSGIGSKQPHMASGGLPTKYAEAAPKGHNPEFITGVTGYYAGGKGTGQSDDIPAMLHDGDYVMDADAVAALGDGSSKAGNEALMKFLHQIPHEDKKSGEPVPAKIADGEVVLPASFVTALGKGDNKYGAKILDGLREKLRAHKRSAPTSKIPPKAKSPLDYAKMVKG